MSSQSDSISHQSFDWESKEDQYLPWFRTSIKPVTPLSWDLLHARMNAVFEEVSDTLLLPLSSKRRLFQGYLYVTTQVPAQGSEEELAERKKNYLLKVAEYQNKWRKEFLSEILGDIAELKKFDLKRASLEELIEQLERVLVMYDRHWTIHFLAMKSMGGVPRFLRVYKGLTGSGDELEAMKLLQGFPNKALETNFAIWKLSRLIKASESLISVVQSTPPLAWLLKLRETPKGGEMLNALEEFLQEYGYRTAAREDIFQNPTWLEDPTPLLTLIKGYLDHNSSDPEEEHKALVREREVAVNALFEKIKNTEELEQFKVILEKAQRWAPFLEDHNFYIDQMSYAFVRLIVIEMGKRLQKAGLLNDPEEVFFLTRAELIALARNPRAFEISSLVGSRGKGYEELMEKRPPLQIGNPDP
ncbi:MAG: hypothetical protein HY731_15175, partial [Candidatus Tectomicrobia bacterium]|nr:hypothetical protein [Candidatus Tectomicrobia bacterium]